MDANLSYGSPQSADGAEKSLKNLFVLRASEVKTDSVPGNFVLRKFAWPAQMIRKLIALGFGNSPAKAQSRQV